MKLAAVIPVKKLENSKTRLCSFLSKHERFILSELMLKNTLNILKNFRFLEEIVVISNDENVRKISRIFATKFMYAEENGVNNAVKIGDEFCLRKRIDANIVIPTDLILLNPSELELIYLASANEKRCSVICPSLREDGTNLLLRKPINTFQTSYDNNSLYNHLISSKMSHVHTIVVSSAKLSLDLDTVDDIKYLLNKYPNSRISKILKKLLV